MKRYAWMLLVVLGLSIQGCVTVEPTGVNFEPSQCIETYRWEQGKGFQHLTACIKSEPIPEGQFPL